MYHCIAAKVRVSAGCAQRGQPSLDPFLIYAHKGAAGALEKYLFQDGLEKAAQRTGTCTEANRFLSQHPERPLRKL
jgi:hypothetical protein